MIVSSQSEYREYINFATAKGRYNLYPYAVIALAILLHIVSTLLKDLHLLL